MTVDQMAKEYYLSAATQTRTHIRPKYVPKKVKLSSTIRGDFPIGHMAAAGPGEFECECNQWGAVSVKAENGTMLGLKLDEFDVIEWKENPHV